MQCAWPFMMESSNMKKLHALMHDRMRKIQGTESGFISRDSVIWPSSGCRLLLAAGEWSTTGPSAAADKGFATTSLHYSAPRNPDSPIILSRGRPEILLYPF